MLAILSTHPIQYQAPLWQALARDGDVPFEVWYLSDHATRQSLDSEFKQSFAWDVDLLAGYPFEFLKINAHSDVARFSRLRLAEPLAPQFGKKRVSALWIQGWQVAAYWQAVWQAHAAGIPVWLRGESNDLAPVPLWKKSIKQLALRQLFARTSAFLYIGKANRRLYEKFGVREEQLHPAYYCVDNERFKRQADELRPRRAEIRRQWGIPENSFCVLFAGKFIAKKRPLDLIRAAAHLKKSEIGIQTHLLFAGSGNLGGQLRGACHVVFDAEQNSPPKESAVRANDSPHASFTGFLNQSEIAKAYAAADCLMLPSDYRETWGLVVNEAMASGLPCLVSDSCGCSEDLVDSDHCFPMGDIGAMANALEKMLSEHIASVRLNSQVEKFDLAVTVNTVSNLYHSLAKKR